MSVTHVRLGEGWLREEKPPTAVAPEPTPPQQDKPQLPPAVDVHGELLASIRDSITRLHEKETPAPVVDVSGIQKAIASNRPQKIDHEALGAAVAANIRLPRVPKVDLSPLQQLVEAFNASRPEPLDAEAIGTALAAAVKFPESPIIDLTVLADLKKALEKLDFRMVGRGTGGGGSLSPDITDRVGRLLGHVTVDVTGTFNYKAGVSGTPAIPSTAKVRSITAHCTTAGSLTINGGDTITIPANSQFSETIDDGRLVGPTVVFTGTDSYYVGYLL